MLGFGAEVRGFGRQGVRGGRRRFAGQQVAEGEGAEADAAIAQEVPAGPLREEGEVSHG